MLYRAEMRRENEEEVSGFQHKIPVFSRETGDDMRANFAGHS
jgi:hypothetical protein